MLLNFLKVAFRTLIKDKITSTINILGLTLAFTVCLLVTIYILHELSYDKYHSKGDRIHRLATQVDGASYTNGIAKVSGPWGPAAKANIPEIEDYTRFKKYGQALIEQDGAAFYEDGGFFTDANVFTLFSWQLVKGNRTNALSTPNSVVLTETLAKKYFGNQDPIEQTIHIDNQPIYRVTGVVQDPPENSHFNFSFFVSLSPDANPDLLDWKQNQYYTYLLLKPNTSPGDVAGKMQTILQAHMGAEQSKIYSPFLQPLTDIYLHSDLFRELAINADLSTIRIFEIVAVVILLLAGFNFVNLTTAKGAARAKEVGVRKANGALRYRLVQQFLLESALTGLFAGILAYVLAGFLAKPFGQLMERDLSATVLYLPVTVLLYFGMVMVNGLLAGFYPAFVLSSFKPMTVLKGNYSFKSHSGLRTGLVVLQFVISTGLIFTMLVMNQQVRFMKQKDLGFSRDQIITVPLRDDGSASAIDHIKQRLTTIPGIVSISASSNQPGGSDWGLPYEAVGLAKDHQPPMRSLLVDEDFIKTYGITVVAGRSFSKDFSTDTSAYLINETAARQLEWKDPIGEQLAIPAINREPGPILGIVKDFHYRSLHEQIEPLFFFIRKSWFTQLNIKIDKANTDKVLTQLKQQWVSIEPKFPFTYTFLDEQFEDFYQQEKKLSQLLFYFTVLGIVISCLGLYALSALMVRQRLKEVGIRKVLGASTGGIVALLSFQFARLVLLALIIALPLAWYIMQEWLQGFAFRIRIEWSFFVISSMIVILVAVFTISFQAIKAAAINPIKYLRSE